MVVTSEALGNECSNKFGVKITNLKFHSEKQPDVGKLQKICQSNKKQKSRICLNRTRRHYTKASTIPNIVQFRGHKRHCGHDSCTARLFQRSRQCPSRGQCSQAAADSSRRLDPTQCTEYVAGLNHVTSSLRTAETCNGHHRQQNFNNLVNKNFPKMLKNRTWGDWWGQNP